MANRTAANPSAGGRYVVAKPGGKPVRDDSNSTAANLAPAAAPAAAPDADNGKPSAAAPTLAGKS